MKIRTFAVGVSVVLLAAALTGCSDGGTESGSGGDVTLTSLSVGLQSYATETNVYWNQVMAAALVVSVPIVTGFLLLQRYLVAGLTAGAVK